jgi:hypothetical protein
MAVTRQVDAQTIGRHYLESVRDLGMVRSVHVRETPDWLEIWVITDPIDFDDEDPLYEAGVKLWNEFPDASVLIHVVNPIDYPYDHDLIKQALPTQARSVATVH